MASNKDADIEWPSHSANETAFVGVYDDLDLPAPIDPRFEILIAYNQNTNSFDVNFDGIRKLFTVDNPLRVHACIGHYANSKLIGKILDYAVSLEKSSCSVDDADDLSHVFSTTSEGVVQKCIVAWGQPISGELLEGKTVHHLFLDIWGDFEMDDPMYLVLAGICTALTSSVVLIQKIELEESAWTWMHKVSVVARKILGQYSLEKLMFFVTDWAYADKFMPGERGGRDYLKSFFEGAASKEGFHGRINHLRQQFRSVTCYLFPFNHKQLTFKQHVVASKKFILFEGSSSELSKSYSVKVSLLENILRSLQKPEDYLSCANELEDSCYWKEEASDGQSKTTEAADEQPEGIPCEEFVATTTGDAPEIDFLSTSNAAGYSDTAFGFSGIDLNFSSSSQITFSMDNEIEQSSQSCNSVPERTFSFQEYLKNLQHPNSKETPATNHEKLEAEKIPSSDELLAKLVKNETLEALKNRIKIPVIRTQKGIEVREESTKRPIMSNLPTTVALTDSSISTFSISEQVDADTCNISSPSKAEELKRLPESSIVSDRESSNVCIEEDRSSSPPMMLQSELIDLGANFLRSLNLEDLYDTHVDDVFARAMQLVEERSFPQLTSSQHAFFKSQLKEIFSALDSYIEEMDSGFKNQTYFVTARDLQEYSKEVLDKLYKKTDIKIDSIWKAVHHKISDLEKLYIDINDEVQAKEAENAAFASNLALQLYQQKMSGNQSSEDEVSKQHKKWSKVSKDAFVQVYKGPDETTNSYLRMLHEKLEEMLTQKISDFRTLQEPNILKNLTAQISSKFESEVDRSVLRNASISMESQFVEMSQTCRSNAERKFTSEISSLSFEGRDELKKHLQTELDEVYTKKLEEFRKKNQTGNYPQGYRDACTLKSDSTLTSEQMEVNDDITSIPAQVGVHFGFEKVSAVLLVDGKQMDEYRLIYGPSDNAIYFTQDEAILGAQLHPTANIQCLLVKDVMCQEDLKGGIYVAGWKSYQVEEIFAMVLSRLHLIVSTSLHTENIAYVVGVPSGLNPTMIDVMGDAIQIAGIQAVVIRETFGLLAKFCYEQPKLPTPSVTTITIVENTDQSADAMGFIVENGQIIPIFLFGYDESQDSKINPRYWVSKFFSSKDSNLGLSRIINKIVSRIPSGTPYNPRVILECSNQTMQRNTNIIKTSSNCSKNWKLYLLSNSKPSIAEGAALVAGYKFNPNFKCLWDRSFPSMQVSLEMMNKNNDSNNYYYRLKYVRSRLDPACMVQASEKEQTSRNELQAKLSNVKTEGKRKFMEKFHEIQDRNIPSHLKTQLLSDLSELTKGIDSEMQSTNEIRRIIYEINCL